MVANAVDGLEALIKSNVVPELLTDQTSATTRFMVMFRGYSMTEAAPFRDRSPDEYIGFRTNNG